MAHTTILGLGGLLGNASACVLQDGQFVSALEQDKITRTDRRPGAFPEEAAAEALRVAGVTPEQVDCLAIARPFTTGAESDAHLHLRSRFRNSDVVVVEHHIAHAASAYFLSNFQSASVLSIDRAGDFRAAVLYQGEQLRLKPLRELYYPDSLGDLYNRVTQLLGFEPRADEHKLQWLSTAGEPHHAQLFRDIVRVGANGWPRFDRSYFDTDRPERGGFSARFYEAVGFSSEDELTLQGRADLAASLQTAVAEAVIAMVGSAERVCLAGGLGYNALLVRALEKHFPEVFVQPVAGNAGTALGAALQAWHSFYGKQERVPFPTLCLGPAYKPTEIKQVLENCKLRFRYLLTEGEVIEQAAQALQDNKILGWMQGRMEFGPRALGNRSILASPLNPYSTENLNVYIKHRESFRKFAASVPEEFASEYFEVGSNANFLATVGKVKPAYRTTFDAAILGDDMIRVHVVRKDENPMYHSLLIEAGKRSNLPVVYNTSFNLFGDPLVCTPRDAVRSFYSSGIDALIAGNFWLEK